jgi:hypothetical protein
MTIQILNNNNILFTSEYQTFNSKVIKHKMILFIHLIQKVK